MKRILILGAGFGGLELATILSETPDLDVEVTIIDKGDAFVFGYAKLALMFGERTLDQIQLPYSEFNKPRVRFINEAITSIDPESKRVVTESSVFDSDYLVIALGADYDLDATPGLAEGGNEFYSVAGADRVRQVLPEFEGGRVVVGVCGAPFKCPPAPSEAALLMHDYLIERGLRDRSEISLVMPFMEPVPPSPETSEALLATFAQRGIQFSGGSPVASLDPARKVAVTRDGTEHPYDLFLGVPKHRAPDVVVASGMTEDGYVPVDSRNLRTRFDGVFAIGDVATVGVPKAGVFSEGAGRVVAGQLIAAIQGNGGPAPYSGRGSCYIEFGEGAVGRVDVDFLSGPGPTGSLAEPSPEVAFEKQQFGAIRQARWFGL